jgi:hypothetical protein
VALAGEAVLTGAPAARRLYREIAAAPGEPLLLSVVGIGGSGKTVLLDALATLYTESGSRVSRTLDGPGPGDSSGADSSGAVLLLDDGHLLDEPTLRRLCALVTGPEPTRLALAARPWPRPAGLAELNALLTRFRPPLLLGNLDRSGVAGRAAPLAEGRPPAALVDYVVAETGGLPALVDRLLGALWESGRVDKIQSPGGSEPPAGFVEQLYYDLECQPEPVRELTLALAVGAPLDTEVLAPLLAVPADEVEELLERARAAGLLGENGAPRPILARTALRRVPSVRRLAVRRRLAQVQLDRGASVLASARDLLETGSTGDRVAAVFEAAADEALRDGSPACSPLARRLLDAAITAGAPPLRLAARGAEAAARSGDLDRALELADQVLANPDEVAEADRIRAVHVAAVALAQRGLLARSAELYRWLGVESLGEGAVVAVPALIGTGALDEARALLEPATAQSPRSPATPLRPPTLLAGAEALMARGVYDTIVGSPAAALSQLARAAALLEPTAATVLLPDTPAALAALVAAHCGELDVAQSVLDRAGAAGLGGAAPAAAGLDRDVPWRHGDRACPAHRRRHPGHRGGRRRPVGWSRVMSWWPPRWRSGWPGAPATWPR